jgi:glycosyltransferase involved in cell wall biosynthesis
MAAKDMVKNAEKEALNKKNSGSYKIGIDARMYGAEQTGIGNYIRNLIINLAQIDKKNQYVIFLSRKEFDKFQVPGDNFKKVKTRSHWYSWREQIALPLDLLGERLDLVHFPHFNSPILYPGKSVVTIHDITPFFFPGNKMNSLVRRSAFRAVFASSIRKASTVIAVSASTKSDIVKHFGAKEDKITVTYEGVSDDFGILPNRDKIRERIMVKYGISKPFIFYTGVWRNHKNIVGLIKAFDIFKKEFGDAYQLVLGGKEDPFYPEVKKTIRDLRLEKDIVCPGFIPAEELCQFYNICSLFVIPSFYEGFGLVGLEAFASGAPVISSRITSLPEVLGESALYFDPNDHNEMAGVMKKVLASNDLKEKMIESGYRRVEDFSWRRMAEETYRIYSRILEGKLS